MVDGIFVAKSWEEMEGSWSLRIRGGKVDVAVDTYPVTSHRDLEIVFELG